MSADGKDDKKKDGDEEEELDCSHPEVVNKYQQAGAVANGVNPFKSLPCFSSFLVILLHSLNKPSEWNFLLLNGRVHYERFIS